MYFPLWLLLSMATLKCIVGYLDVPSPHKSSPMPRNRAHLAVCIVRLKRYLGSMEVRTSWHIKKIIYNIIRSTKMKKQPLGAEAQPSRRHPRTTGHPAQLNESLCVKSHTRPNVHGHFPDAARRLRNTRVFVFSTFCMQAPAVQPGCQGPRGHLKAVNRRQSL